MIIFHVDANSAYLSWTAVSLLEHGYQTDIRTIPAVIAGNPEARHGIILAKSLPAKKYNIQTGESLYEARNKCPNLQVYAPNYDLYLACSDAMYQVLSEYTPLVQRYSVDECFMDVTASIQKFGEPVTIANTIKERIKRELGFTVNVGVSENRLLAKMAGELKKPDMVHTLWKTEIDKMWSLPVRELFMVGRASEKKLHKMNILTIGDLANADISHVRAMLKSHGQLVWEYANGIDNSAVTDGAQPIQKGVGNSTTIAYDITEHTEALQILLALCERVGMRLRKMRCQASLVSVHLTTNGFARRQHQIQLQSYFNTTSEIYRIASLLFDDVWKQEPIRKLGVSVSGLIRDDEVQLNFLDGEETEKQQQLELAVDQIRNKYGKTSIVRCGFVHSGVEALQGGVNDGDYLMMGGFMNEDISRAD